VAGGTVTVRVVQAILAGMVWGVVYLGTVIVFLTAQDGILRP
jgi:hypothetical protein